MEWVTKDQLICVSQNSSSGGVFFSVEFIISIGWQLFVVEKDLMATGHGRLVRVAGATDRNGSVFPAQDGVMITGPVEKFLVAKISTSGVPTTLQTFIKDAVREHVEETRSGSSLLANSAGTGRSG
jgi:hypothetical protein